MLSTAQKERNTAVDNFHPSCHVSPLFPLNAVWFIFLLNLLPTENHTAQWNERREWQRIYQAVYYRAKKGRKKYARLKLPVQFSKRSGRVGRLPRQTGTKSFICARNRKRERNCARYVPGQSRRLSRFKSAGEGRPVSDERYFSWDFYSCSLVTWPVFPSLGSVWARTARTEI